MLRELFRNSNKKLIENIYYTNIQHRKYFVSISTKYNSCGEYHKYDLLIDNNGNCYTRKPNGEYIKFHTMTNNSILLHDGNNVIIVTGNHIITIISHDHMIQFTLPIKSIQHIGSNRIGDLVWYNQMYHKLPSQFKSNIKTFVLCNRLMKQFKIPHCVLPIIFNNVIN